MDAHTVRPRPFGCEGWRVVVKAGAAERDPELELRAAVRRRRDLVRAGNDLNLVRISFRLTKPVVLGEIAVSDGWAALITMSNYFPVLGPHSGPKVLFLVNFT